MPKALRNGGGRAEPVDSDDRHKARCRNKSRARVFVGSSRRKVQYQREHWLGRIAPIRAFVLVPAPGVPRCIHEVPSPSLVLSPSSPHPGLDPNFNLDSGLFTAEYPQNTTVHYKGSISLVDEDTAITGFEACASLETPAPALDPNPSALAAWCTAAQERHLVLLRQWAAMLEQIARLEGEGYHDDDDGDG
ncbi:hypothetical protein B0H10DRAFT_2239826 [Mycena sp. CBHHK59/15]|nr:hypothetical protein B0H10DRAFT_2239826 [Mycena sp. CBHHK59/15]